MTETPTDATFSVQDDEEINLPDGTRYVIERPTILAVRAAMVTRRPLLVLGEPGVGKSALACAVAAKTNRPLISHVVNFHSEPEDLFWRYDAVGRIAAAHGIVNPVETKKASESHQYANKNLHELANRDSQALQPIHFLTPGPLWWAFDPISAEVQYDECHHKLCAKPEEPSGVSLKSGAVVLIDEIDKAEIDYPNALLEVFGQRSFSVPYLHDGAKDKLKLKDDRVKMKDGKEPFVILTSNRERSLPEAFVRRCWVLNMRLPREKEKFVERLMAVAKAHFNLSDFYKDKDEDEDVVRDVIAKLHQVRSRSEDQQLPMVGQAEFIDTLTALKALAKGKEQATLWKDLCQYSFSKHETIHQEYVDND